MDQGPGAARSGTDEFKQSGKSGAGTRKTPGSTAAGLRDEATSKVGEVAQQAMHAAGSLAAQANDQVMRLADRQVSVGADIVDRIAEAVRSAADTLDADVPQLSQLARSAAERIDDFSDTIREQSAGDLLQASANFARQRPALLFGAAAAGGFLLYRLFSTSASSTAPSWDDEGDFAEWDNEGTSFGRSGQDYASGPTTPDYASGPTKSASSPSSMGSGGSFNGA